MTNRRPRLVVPALLALALVAGVLGVVSATRSQEPPAAAAAEEDADEEDEGTFAARVASDVDVDAPAADDATWEAAMAGRDGPPLLYVQDAESGTYTPAEADGEFWLELHGADPMTLWFEDRPGERAGAVPNQEMLDVFFSGGEEPPNAAIDAWDTAAGRDVVTGVKLLDGTWDPETRTLRYRVRPLVMADGELGPESRIGTELPQEFGEAGLFIDDGPGLGGSAEGQLAVDVYKAVAYLVNSISDRRTCSAIVENATYGELRWVGDDSKGTDSWRQNPARLVRSFTTRDDDRFTYWTTSGGFMRGCWNWVQYRGPNGTVTVGLSDPWTGSNDYFCQTTGTYRCIPLQEPLTSWSGNHLIATYCVFEERSGENWCNDW